MLADQNTWVFHTWTLTMACLSDQLWLIMKLPRPSTGLPHRLRLLGATSGSPGQVRVRVALRLSLVWITGHHPLLKATIQVTSDEVHRLVARDVHS